MVRKYTPNVVCGREYQREGEPSRSPCADTLSRIPVSVFDLVFGREGVPGVSWNVPWSYQAGMCVPCQIALFGRGLSNRRYANTCLALVIENSRCQFNIDLSETEKATMRWFDIWAAAIAADVRKSHSTLTLAEKHLLPIKITAFSPLSRTAGQKLRLSRSGLHC